MAKPQPPAKLPIETGLFGLVANTGKPILVEDWRHAPERLRARALETDKETGSLIAVPLMHEESVIGVVSVQHTEANVYSGADLNLLQRLAEHLAAAVADARAFEDLESYRAGLEERVQSQIKRLLRDPKLREILRYPNATVSGDHYVLPVAVNHRHKIQGVVHRTSSTGETLFVEPASLAALSSERAVLKGEEDREVRRILRKLSGDVGRVSKPLSAACSGDM